MPTVITNVRVFDGLGLSQPVDLILERGVVGRSRTPAPSDEIVDAGGGVALPGLIDAHAHVDDEQQLHEYAQWGVTTVLDMGAPRLGKTLALKQATALPAVFSAGVSASGPDSSFIRDMGFPEDSAVPGPEHAQRFVSRRIAEGSDYIKILLDDPAFPGASPLAVETVHAIVASARSAGLLTIAHIVSGPTLATALQADVDIVTHTPLAGEIDKDLRDRIRASNATLVPTLGMMNGVIRAMADEAPLSYSAAEATVRAFHETDHTVLVGTDANTEDIPFNPTYGASVHEELMRLVDVGLTPAEALRGAGLAAARLFGLSDRGLLSEGLRADVVLLNANPLADISATRDIRGVWICGERVA
jgi:imidazolonepropionase-like amidohydrolase